MRGGYWSRRDGKYMNSVPWYPFVPSSVRISGPSPHTTKYSNILAISCFILIGSYTSSNYFSMSWSQWVGCYGFSDLICIFTFLLLSFWRRHGEILSRRENLIEEKEKEASFAGFYFIFVETKNRLLIKGKYG